MNTHASTNGITQKVFLVLLAIIGAIVALLLPSFASAAAPIGELGEIRAGLCFRDDQPECLRFQDIERNYAQRLMQGDRQGTLTSSREQMEIRRLWRRLQLEHLVTLLTVSKNEAFTIALQSNPSTGYGWSASFDDAYLSYEDTTYIAPSRVLPGAGGEERLRFAALKNGVTTVALRYALSWDNSRPAKAMIYLIHIR